MQSVCFSQCLACPEGFRNHKRSSIVKLHANQYLPKQSCTQRKALSHIKWHCFRFSFICLRVSLYHPFSSFLSLSLSLFLSQPEIFLNFLLLRYFILALMTPNKIKMKTICICYSSMKTELNVTEFNENPKEKRIIPSIIPHCIFVRYFMKIKRKMQICKRSNHLLSNNSITVILLFVELLPVYLPLIEFYRNGIAQLLFTLWER